MTQGFFLAGHAANACINATSVTPSSADSLFPASNLQDGFLWSPFKFADAEEVNPNIEFDNNVVVNGTFEADPNGTSPATGWTNLNGTPDVSTAQANDGTRSYRLDAADDAAYQDKEVAVGTTHRLTAALYGDGTNAINLYVINLDTHEYLNSSQSWVTTKSAWHTKTTTGFGVKTETFTLPAPLEGHFGPVNLRLLVERPGTIAGAAYIDSVAMWPKVTVAALLGHTIPTSMPIAAESDDNASFSSVTDNGDLPALPWSTYLNFTGPATLERYWRFQVTGTLVAGRDPTWVAQPLLGEAKDFVRSPRIGYGHSGEMPTGGTEDQPVALQRAPTQALDMSWQLNETALRQLNDELISGSRGGVEPVLIVPDRAKAVVLYGRGAALSTAQVTRRSLTAWEYSLSMQGDRAFVEVR